MTDVVSSPQTLLARAIEALTAAARLTRTVGAGTDTEHQEQADWAEFVTLAVAGAAANIGSVEKSLAGRPGSWEAERVRGLLLSTVGEDPAELLRHRTEPLTVVVNVDDILNDIGYSTLYYDDAEAELARREDAIGIPRLIYRPDDPTYEARAAALSPATDEQEAALDRFADLQQRLEDQRLADWTAYGEVFRSNVLSAAQELLPGLPVPVEVTVNLEWQNSLGAGEDFDGPAAMVWTRARLDTPLPGSGIAFKDYPLTPAVADTERAAGRLPLTRLEAAQPGNEA